MLTSPSIGRSIRHSRARMEFEVRALGGIEDFFSLPLALIQMLQQSTPSVHLPHLLALELRFLVRCLGPVPLLLPLLRWTPYSASVEAHIGPSSFP
ncbi:hypothetical protein SAY87_029094 [Trapa incisa]|uniref:Uncharacterized protein n=2 Tax=Trapa TaxID=22665 RepID=A0AAN7M1J3_TRANT|nr:hypothetical protein SAY87_029094 [Trapa incisa]KAK4790118.1 hypothetical protein SAY86_017422 [Trapa natans]